jgi:hypothetical protein
VFEPLSTSDRAIVERFVNRVDKLERTAFAGEKTGLRATSIPGATYMGGPAWHLGLDGADQTDGVDQGLLCGGLAASQAVAERRAGNGALRAWTHGTS